MATGMLIGQVDYESQIQTILDANCTDSGCHTNGGGYQGGLDLSSYDNLMAGSNSGAVVTPLDHANSSLWQKVNSGAMPPGNSPDLNGDEVNLIASWIDEGALEDTPNYITIAEARVLAEGTITTVRGIVTTPNYQTSNTEYGLQDATAGIIVFKYGELLSMTVGDSVEVTGELDEYNGKFEIVPSGASDITVISQNNPLPNFQIITVATLVANGEDYESELIRINDASITSGSWPTSGSANLDISDDGGTSTVAMRIDSDMDIIGNPEPAAPFNVQGIAGQFTDYQILPRYYTDFSSAGASAPSIGSIAFEPSSPTEADDVTVSAAITDDGTIASATLTYSAGSAETDVAMAYTTGDIYTGTIPAQAAGTTVTFSITAVDNEDGTTTSAESSYSVNSTGGEITSIHDIQYTTDASGDSPLDGQTVTISGIVTAEFWGSSSNRYLYVQDAEGPWNGVVCFEYGGWDTFDFSSSAGIVHSVAEGDSVTVTGTVGEYYGLTQITDVTGVIIHGPAVNMISPAAVTPGQIMTGGSDAEAYEGCLVTLENVTVDNPDLNNGEWSVTDGTNSVRLDDIWDYYYFPEMGQALAGIAGVMTYSYSNAKLEPRLARDVVEADGGPVRLQRVQQVLFSDLIKASEDKESDKTYMYDDTVTVRGIVTMPTGLSYAGEGVKFIFADVNGGPWSSILCYDPDSSAFPTLYEGDLIEATGKVFEYESGDANMTELFITEPINVIDFEQPLPVVDTVKTGDLRSPRTAEQWGNVMVRIEDAVVTQTAPSSYEPFVIDDNSGEVWIDDDSDSVQTYFEEVGVPPVGSLVQFMEGWVYHHFGSYADSNTYKLCPLYVEDIGFGSGPPSITHLSREPCAPTASDNEVAVSCVILDNSTISEALVHYSVDGGEYASVAMTSANDSIFTGLIPVANTNTVYYYITATDDGADQSEPKTSVYPNNTAHDQLGFHVSDNLTIGMVQETPWPSGKTMYEGCNVALTGIVTADTAQYNSSYSSYAFQDGTGQWNGLVFDTEEMAIVTRGDEVSVTGLVTDNDPDWDFKFGGNTRLINATVTVTSTGNDTPAPTGVSASDLAQTAEEVESYEGVLVKLENVTVSSVGDYDWSITDASGVEALIDDDMATMSGDNALSELVEGQQLSYVMGIFNYSFGTYKVQIRDVADLGASVGIDDDVKVNPYEYALHDNFPNPFNPETQIRFSLGGQENVKLVIYNIMGRQVRTLVNGDSFSSGFHIVNWYGTDNAGQKVPSGMYIYRIKAGDFVADKKMLLVK